MALPDEILETHIWVKPGSVHKMLGGVYGQKVRLLITIEGIHAFEAADMLQGLLPKYATPRHPDDRKLDLRQLGEVLRAE